MDDLIEAVASKLEEYPIAATPVDARNAARDVIAAILRQAGSKPDPVEVAFRAGWFGSRSWWRGAMPDQAYADWRSRTLDTTASPMVKCPHD